MVRTNTQWRGKKVGVGQISDRQNGTMVAKVRSAPVTRHVLN